MVCAPTRYIIDGHFVNIEDSHVIVNSCMLSFCYNVTYVYAYAPLAVQIYLHVILFAFDIPTYVYSYHC